jgi:hypothetical protein
MKASNSAALTFPGMYLMHIKILNTSGIGCITFTCAFFANAAFHIASQFPGFISIIFITLSLPKLIL